MNPINGKPITTNLRRVPPRGRALVAGAAGFIGSHLCDRLVAEGFEVVGVDNFLTGRRKNLVGLERDARFEFLEHDIIQPLPDFGYFDWVFHLASPASPPAYQRHSIECLRVNSEGTLNLLEIARKGRSNFFLASTSEVYGDPLQHPQLESYWGNVNPVGPRSVYDEAKRFAESMVVDYNRVHRLPIRLIRIFNTYGPRMDPEDGRVVSNFICQALRGKKLTVYGDGSQTRSFQYVDDLVEAICRLMRVDHQTPINLGNPDEYTIRELVTVLQEALGRPLDVEYHPLPHDDPKQRRPDIGLAESLLDWRPRVPVAEGLRKTVEYFASELGCESPALRRDGKSVRRTVNSTTLESAS